MFPWIQHYENSKQDHSSGHHGYATDALVASRVNRGPAHGPAWKQSTMRGTVVDIADIGEDVDPEDHKLEPIAGKPGKFSQ